MPTGRAEPAPKRRPARNHNYLEINRLPLDPDASVLAIALARLGPGRLAVRITRAVILPAALHPAIVMVIVIPVPVDPDHPAGRTRRTTLDDHAGRRFTNDHDPARLLALHHDGSRLLALNNHGVRFRIVPVNDNRAAIIVIVATGGQKNRTARCADRKRIAQKSHGLIPFHSGQDAANYLPADLISGPDRHGW